MKIESIIQRKDGTTVVMDEETYIFKPNPKKGDKRHIANVKEQSHIAKFLAITEGFRIAEEKTKAVVKEEPKEPEKEKEDIDQGQPPEVIVNAGAEALDTEEKAEEDAGVKEPEKEKEEVKAPKKANKTPRKRN